MLCVKIILLFVALFLLFVLICIMAVVAASRPAGLAYVEK